MCSGSHLRGNCTQMHINTSCEYTQNGQEGRTQKAAEKSVGTGGSRDKSADILTPPISTGNDRDKLTGAVTRWDHTSVKRNEPGLHISARSRRTTDMTQTQKVGDRTKWKAALRLRHGEEATREGSTGATMGLLEKRCNMKMGSTDSEWRVFALISVLS